MEIAIGTARWMVGRALGPVTDGLLESWAASSKLGPNIHALKMELLYAQGMLDNAQGREFRSGALRQLLLELRNLAYSADDVLDELDYFRIQDELEGTYETTDTDTRGLICDLALNARHTARAVAGKLTCFCGAERHGDPADEREEATQGCISSAARIVGKRLPCSLPSVHDDAGISMPGNGRQFLCGAWPSKTRQIEHPVHAPKLKFDRVEMSNKMTDIVEQLKPICRKVSTILDKELLGTAIQKIEQMGSNGKKPGTIALDRPKTTPQIIEPELYGRGKQKKDVVDNITGKYSVADLTVLPVFGPGGIGKTTFIQHIYAEVKSHFDIPIWTCVSLNFNASRLAQEILKQIPEGTNENKNSRDEELIESRLQSKRFLLVLDDIWTYHNDEWKKLLAPFQRTGTKGNIVIVTTRIPQVAKMVDTMNCSIKLEHLEPEEFLRLFKDCVFGDQRLWEDHPQLHDVGGEIVGRLKGFPLAAKTVGRLLRNHLTLDHWTRVLESKEWEHQTGDDDIMPALKLSYDCLSFPLQQCFMHCALFPGDYEFKMEELINLWIGLGLLGSTIDESKRIEDKGQNYLDDLVNHGFFELNEKEYGGTSYVIHDLLHELAVNVSSYECLSIKGSDMRSIQVLKSVRHLSIHIDDTHVKDRMAFGNSKRDLSIMGKRLKVENIRTLMIFGEHHGSFYRTFSDLFKDLKSLRVIFLSDASYNVEDLFPNFSKFVHLRYLRVHNGYYSRETLPCSISRFYHLMVLDVQNWTGQFDFLRDMRNLVNLRHFLVPDNSIHSEISEVGKLINFQELRRFEVKREINGFELKQIGQLIELRGSLEIYNLEKVQTIIEADEAKIAHKKHLIGLTLDWDNENSNMDPTREQHVLESLKPHSNIKEICIREHGHTTLPTWLGLDLPLKNLESLHLEGVAWNILPLPGRLCMVNEHGGEDVVSQGQLHNLKRLELVKIPMLKKWRGNGTCHLLPRLEELIVSDCSELIELPFSHSTIYQSGQMKSLTCFPKLRVVRISHCNQLQSLPPIPWTHGTCSIEVEEVCSVFKRLSYTKDKESKSSLWIVGNSDTDSKLWNVLAFGNLTELEALSIWCCPPVPLERLQMLKCLKTMTILDSEASLWQDERESGIKYDLPVERLDINNCGASGVQLTRLLSYFPNLSYLDMGRCENVTGLGVLEQQTSATTASLASASTNITEDTEITLQKKQKAGGKEKTEAPTDEGLLLVPPKIQELRVWRCPHLSLRSNLLDDGTATAAAAGGGGLQALHSLRILVAVDCPKLLSSASYCPFPTSLQRLSIHGDAGLKSLETLVPLTNLTELGLYNSTDLYGRGLGSLLAHGRLTNLQTNSIPNLFDDLDGQHLSNSSRLQQLSMLGVVGLLEAPICRFLSSSLTMLTLWGLDEVRSFTTEQEEALQILTSLQDLKIIRCPKMQFLPAGLSGLPSLKRLQISFCSAIRSLDGLPSSLQKLEISYCEAIRSLDGLPRSLQILLISNCPAIRSLPKGGLPTSLRELDVRYSESEELKRQCRKLRGKIPIIRA